MDVFELVSGAHRAYLRDAVVHAAHGLRGAPRTRRYEKLVAAMSVLGIDPARLPPDPPLPPGGWGSLAEVIRTDRPLPEDAASLERFHAHLLEAGAAPARELWQLLRVKGPLLDLGGGTGAYTNAFLQENPGEQATLADKPEVLRLAKAPGATLLPVDLLNMSVAAPVVLLANVLHLFGPRQIARILRGIDAGTLVVKDLRSDTDEGVLFALNMALFTEEGDVHPVESIEQWLRDAGYAQTRRHSLRTSPNSLVLTAAKP